MSAIIIRIRDYRGPVVAATCAKCRNDNLKPFGGPALNFCSHCGFQFPRMFGNPLQQPEAITNDSAEARRANPMQRLSESDSL